jgi:hypothetical protein
VALISEGHSGSEAHTQTEHIKKTLTGTMDLRFASLAISLGFGFPLILLLGFGLPYIPLFGTFRKVATAQMKKDHGEREGINQFVLVSFCGRCPLH